MGRVKTSYPRIQHLLVPLDFSGKSRQALRYAVPIAQKFFAKITLIHVVQPDQHANARADLLVADRIRQKDVSLKRLEELATQLVPRGRRGGNLVRFGRPADAILDAINTLAVDLVVMTTHARTGLNRFFMGSTAERVMRHASCPVLSIRRH